MARFSCTKIIIIFFYVLLFLLLSCTTLQNTKTKVKAFPLHTNGRWIVDEEEGGKRVKLACLSWMAHGLAVVAEGLSKQPLDSITKRIRPMGFNCIRLTWPLELVINESLASLTVKESFNRLGLFDDINGIQAHNPSILDLPLINAFQTVVKSLGDNNVMVILDNHCTKPSMCCSETDQNGFFGDKYFDPHVWIKGLTKMATMFNGVTNVVAMSLRNEPRGPRSNLKDWYRYMAEGAEAVHGANPNVLVIISGLVWDQDLSFLKNQPLKLSFNGKLVFEVHQYSYGKGPGWQIENPNKMCAKILGEAMRNSSFLLEQGRPVMLSEFGVNMKGSNLGDNRFLNCYLGMLAELDMDWALWTLVGSYYIRNGDFIVGAGEVYGVLNEDWIRVRNASILHKISAVQLPFRGPGLSSKAKQHKVIFHPLTGLCVLTKSTVDPLRLGPCSNSDHWQYKPQEKKLSIEGTLLCLKAYGEGKAPKLGRECSSPNSTWKMVSDSKMHLSSRVNKNGSSVRVCLDVDTTNNIIVTNTCKCLTTHKSCDAESQWFKLVDSVGGGV
ncbi:glycosyl hydrolase 5 family protein [Arachis duranensis]|uniref:Glycosyl hydrolase 5 family protein n=1 Tax=Arachis duranensis TaxID=130453 RepID=A0A6P4B889_ARADU|nr:glycosyl hydrolase 5 family protein [Arachis duranensis]